MNLEQQIAQISNPQDFVDICNAVFTEIYKDNFQIIDGTRSDEGNDGYISSEERLLAMYCPIKPTKKTDNDYLDKIYSDLKKAKELRDSGKLKIEKWTFITPSKLSHNVIVNLKKKAEEFNLEGNHQEATFLSGEILKNKYLLERFPFLQISDIGPKIDEILKIVKNSSESFKEKSTLPINQKIYEKEGIKHKESEDLKEVLEIIGREQAETSKGELKAIYYKTIDKIAQVNAIIGLIQWYDPLDDKLGDMVEWCNQGIFRADYLKDRLLKTIFLSLKGKFISDIWSHEDMEGGFLVQASNKIGIPLITEDQQQKCVHKLRQLQDEYENAFKEALDIAFELKSASALAQICLNIGQAAGLRYIHLAYLEVKDRAEKEKTLTKRVLLTAKELYAAIGNELGVGYAIHNLANQLVAFGEKKEALELTKTVLEIAKKYKDTSLLQTANWLEESLPTGKIPDYVHGERRERKK